MLLKRIFETIKLTYNSLNDLELIAVKIYSNEILGVPYEGRCNVS